MQQNSSTTGIDLSGKTAVVTGASSGIGRAIATTLASHGARVRLHGGARRQLLEDVVRELSNAGWAVDGLSADLAVPDEQDRLVDQCLAELGQIDIWVNNAGVDVLTGPAAELSFEEKLERLWSVDVVATMRMARRIGKAMRDRAADGDRVILNMGWDQAEWGQAGDSGQLFGTTKGAVIAFSRSLAKSLAPDVRVNCLAPGWIRTDWGNTASTYWDERARRESLLGRWGTPDDVARVACFLVSPAAAFVNGQVAMINGGFQTNFAEPSSS